MSYSPIAIANYFIERATREGMPIDHLKLQKLVYIAHGWSLAIHGRPLIREDVQAWKYGPVIKSLYHQLKGYGNSLIMEPIARVRGLELETPEIDFEDQRTVELLERVWEVYKDYNGVQLSNLTHQQGTPWDRAWSEHSDRRNLRIDNHMIEEHFRELGSRASRA